MLEAVASYDCGFGIFFGVASANNNLTILNNPLLVDDLLHEIAQVAPFEVNGVTYEKWINTSIGAEDMGFRRGNQANKLTQGYYAVSSIIKEDDLSESSLRRNIDDKVTPGFRIAESIRQTSNANSGSRMAEGEIDNLTMEQYLALTRGNQAPGVVKPEIEGNVNYEIKSQFMRELREDTFFGNKNDDAHEHVEQVLDIVSLFNIPGVSHDAVMLRVFLITLTGVAKSHQKVNIFYNGLGTMNRQLLDSHEPIPDMTPAQALTTIQTITDHSQKWHDGSFSRNIYSSSNVEGIAAILSKLDSLGRDMKKLKENVHAIQVGCQTCGGAYLDKECPLNEEVKSMEEDKYGEFKRPSPFSKAKYRVGPLGYYTRIENSPPFGFANKEGPLDNTINEPHEVSFVSNNNIHAAQVEGVSSRVLPFQLPPKELNPRSFTLPCTIGSLNFYSMADLGASVNVIPKTIFEHLKLARLKKTDMLLEMVDMIKRAPIGIVENVFVKIDKFLFPSDFVVIDMIKTSNETMILGRSFLTTIHTEIDVFNKEISL
ncbi:putative reverse transcriptase domain-containing protein [Tanacetum coccineum]